MVFQGHIENGVVVFSEPVPLPNGTAVRVVPMAAPSADFWESCSLDELARRQGVSVPRSTEEMLGGWPDDELDDGFEEVVGSWRDSELEIRGRRMGGSIMTIRAVFENGVFRPMDKAKLAEGTVVDLQVMEEVVDVRSLVPPGTDEGLIQVYEILGRRFDSGHHDTAERHNEHQP